MTNPPNGDKNALANKLKALTGILDADNPRRGNVLTRDSNDGTLSEVYQNWPDQLEMPQIIHSIWLGSALSNHGAMAQFRANVEKYRARFGDQFGYVLWTDITRERFELTRTTPAPTSGVDPLAREREMLAWATQHNVNLINVDEVFNAQTPMRLAPEYKLEVTKPVRRGYAAASDIARWEIVKRFGGLYIDGDNAIAHLNELADVFHSPEAATLSPTLTDGDIVVGNDVIVAPRQHPLADHVLDLIKDNYTKTQDQLYLQFDTPTHSEEWVTSKFHRLRRNSVMVRTGPTAIKHKLGRDYLATMRK